MNPRLVLWIILDIIWNIHKYPRFLMDIYGWVLTLDIHGYPIETTPSQPFSRLIPKARPQRRWRSGASWRCPAPGATRRCRLDPRIPRGLMPRRSNGKAKKNPETFWWIEWVLLIPTWHYKVVPPVDSVQLVNITPISLYGLWLTYPKFISLLGDDPLY